VKVGTTTLSGSSPASTPNKIVPGLFIAVSTIDASFVPASILADMLTAGDACAVDGFVSSNETVYVVAAVVPELVRTSRPMAAVQAAVVPNASEVEETVNNPSGVDDAVRPEMVTLEPESKLQLALKETLKVLVAPGIGVLC
jgi:hypothetical protein